MKELARKIAEEKEQQRLAKRKKDEESQRHGDY
jgi:hypothetical protein